MCSDLSQFLLGGCFQNVVHKLSFSKVVSAREQVVAGTMYYLRIVVLESGTPKLYDCKIWVKPWENFKQLESFVPVVSPQCTLTDNPDTTSTAAGNSSILL
jgi:cystatin-C